MRRDKKKKAGRKGRRGKGEETQGLGVRVHRKNYRKVKKITMKIREEKRRKKEKVIIIIKTIIIKK